MLKLSDISTWPTGVSAMGVLTLPGLTRGRRARPMDDMMLAINRHDCCSLWAAQQLRPHIVTLQSPILKTKNKKKYAEQPPLDHF